jgi:hypothetical protein
VWGAWNGRRAAEGEAKGVGLTPAVVDGRRSEAAAGVSVNVRGKRTGTGVCMRERGGGGWVGGVVAPQRVHSLGRQPILDIVRAQRRASRRHWRRGRHLLRGRRRRRRIHGQLVLVRPVRLPQGRSRRRGLVRRRRRRRGRRRELQRLLLALLLLLLLVLRHLLLCDRGLRPPPAAAVATAVPAAVAAVAAAASTGRSPGRGNCG